MANRPRKTNEDFGFDVPASATSPVASAAVGRTVLPPAVKRSVEHGPQSADELKDVWDAQRRKARNIKLTSLMRRFPILKTELKKKI